MAPGAAAKFPEFKSYRARAVNDASISGRLDYSPAGFHGMIHTSEGTVFIDPVPLLQADQYNSYYKHDYVSENAPVFSCGVLSNSTAQNFSPLRAAVLNARTAARTSNELRSYRLAVGTTVQYGSR